MIISKVIDQYKKYKLVPATKNLIYHWLTREKRCSFGDKNSDKIFYIIRSIDSNSPFYIGPVHNLLANYFYVLSHIQYAKINGWIPIVDQLNYPVYNSVDYPINGSMNAWEYFWKQPSPYTLEEVYNSKNVILSKQNWFSEYDMGYDVKKYSDSECISFFYQLSSEIPFNGYVKNYIDERVKSVFCDKNDILGVSFRFGGHSLSSYKFGKGHPVQPAIEEILPIIKNKMKKWGMQYVFLCSDVIEAINAFYDIFGKCLLVLDRPRMSMHMSKKEREFFYKNESIYTISLDYLTEMEALSKCTCLLGSVNSGLRYAIIKNKNLYSYVEILDYGLLPSYK
ncbi:hypothetical protein QVN49_03910 [Megasphaera hexanoica]|nr:hypothetical protein [Megasphaera hexanoica]